MGPKKLALWFLIISVAISAVLGIIVILTGNFGDFEIRIILTTLTISAASICALASGALWEGRNQRNLPAAGIVLALLAAILLITEFGLSPVWWFLEVHRLHRRLGWGYCSCLSHFPGETRKAF